jgi:hypothetical protein
VGRYTLRLKARFCSTFQDSVRIEPGKTNRQQIPMICQEAQPVPSDTE